MKKRIWLMILSMTIGVFVAFGIGPMASAVDAQSSSQNFADLSADLSFGSGLVLNPEGKGDVLIFPYYDVRNIGTKAQQTLFAIINQTPSSDCAFSTKNGVAAKIRFREFDKSEEVFDADIWLSCNDVWVGALTRNTATGLTTLTSPDLVISAPTGPGCPTTGSPTFTVSALLSSGVDFFTDKVTNTPPAGLTKADLTNMGYIEVIGEERTFSKVAGGKVTRITTENPDALNTLTGYAFVVDGASIGYNATAIANFRTDGFCLFFGAGSTDPQLTAAQDGLAQLEFQLSKANISHGYSIESSIAGKFSMVVTFPTKHFHFEGKPHYSLIDDPSIAPPFTGETSNFGENATAKVFDRLEAVCSPELSPFSPRTTSEFFLPHEVTVMGVYKGSAPSLPAVGERNTFPLVIPTACSGFDTGWIWIDLTRGVNDPPGPSHFAICSEQLECNLSDFNFFDWGFSEYDGLPVIAMGLQEFSNGAVGGFYGDLFPAFYDVDWVLD